MKSLLVRRNPFREILDIANTFGRWPEWSLSGSDADDFETPEWSPSVDIDETDEEFKIRAELPGVKKEDVHVTVENGRLTLSGEKKMEIEEKSEKSHRKERFYGSFTRAFTLPQGVQPEKAEARYQDGVLCLSLPKSEEAKVKQIDIKVC